MRKIKEEDVKVGDFVYGRDKKHGDFRFILQKTPRKKKGKSIFKVWFLKDESERIHLLELNYFAGETNLGEQTFKYYTIRKLNKKEILEFTKILILKNL